MILIWQRWGPIGLVFLALGFLLWVTLAAIVRAAFGIVDSQGWWNVASLVIGFGTGAIANWLFAVKVVEPKLDRPHNYPPVAPSTLFFLRLRDWTWAIVAIGLVFLVPNILDIASVI